LRSDYDELQLRYDDEVYNSQGWKKEKERLETRINDLTKAYESNAGAATEQQDQIVSLHSQVRELRSVLNDAEADRALLQKARRALQAELETIKLDSVDTNKITSDRELQRLNLMKLDLERSLEEKEDRVKISFERMKKAEAHASDCQAAVDRVRVENSELDRLNAHLEKQVKDLKVQIVDLETKSWARSPRASAGSSSRRIEELTSQLNQATDSSKSQAANKAIRQQADFDRQRAKLEEERRGYEVRMEELRRDMDSIQSRETELHTAKRRAEREAAESKQKALK
jgi:myosin protein heavy chain